MGNSSKSRALSPGRRAGRPGSIELRSINKSDWTKPPLNPSEDMRRNDEYPSEDEARTEDEPRTKERSDWERGEDVLYVRRIQMRRYEGTEYRRFWMRSTDNPSTMDCYRNHERSEWWDNDDQPEWRTFRGVAEKRPSLVWTPSPGEAFIIAERSFTSNALRSPTNGPAPQRYADLGGRWPPK